MWARIVEIMLGFWLLASPFIFQFGENEAKSWANDLSCGLAVIILGLSSYWRPTEWAHFLILAVALWLIAFGYSAGHPAPAAAQNRIICGLLIGMFAIIPNRTNEMPDGWRKYYDEKRMTSEAAKLSEKQDADR